LQFSRESNATITVQSNENNAMRIRGEDIAIQLEIIIVVSGSVLSLRTDGQHEVFEFCQSA
jgi:hypothetical protein